MEEWVGQLWHRFITRQARREHPEAAVSLSDVRREVAILFRALGGDPGLRVEIANETAHGARRRWLERIAGTGTHVELAWRDAETLRLPGRIAWFAEPDLNRDLYLWLAALASVAGPPAPGEDWLQRNARMAARVLENYPGLRSRYVRLVAAHLAQRPEPASLPPDEAARERAIRHALEHPGEAPASLPPAARPPWPVPLWLHPEPPVATGAGPAGESPEAAEPEASGPAESVESGKRRRGERVEMPNGRDGLLAFRLESLFTRAEYVRVDRTTEEGEDRDAKSALEDLEALSVARDRERSSTRLRFDLDLPPEDRDDIRLGEGIPLPEWDWKRECLLPDHCRLQRMLARDAEPAPLPAHLRARARRVRALFEVFKPRRIWLSRQADGTEPDIDAWLLHMADRLRGHPPADAALYRDFRNLERDLACLLLADLSLSTDSWVDNDRRVIDVIRDSLFLFSEALAATGDRFALYGFSSRYRSHVRFHHLKGFDETWGDVVRGRIQAIRPGYYTRMGAAIRYATRLLEQEPASQRLLLILTDGKPNDLDRYEGRYGIEDTRVAVHEAIEKGLQPFCVTIDEKARDYLPYLFGANRWLLVRNAAELPKKLPALYARLTA